MSIGDTLANARRQAGLTVSQVSQQTRIRESIIRAIEQDDFSACGGDFYARGHIRSIAGVVGTDPAPLIREYEAEHGPPPSISAAQAFEPTKPIRIREPRRSFGLGWILVAVVILGGAAGGYELSSHHGNSHSNATSASTVRPLVTHKPTPKPTPTHTAKPPATHKAAKPEAVIVLTATQDCWVGISDSSGKQVYQGTVPAGQSMTWHEKHSVSMVIGNPPGIKLTVNGKNDTPNTGQVATVTISPSGSTTDSAGTVPVTTTGSTSG
ncbi:MAG TPA: RodZ domain-containing protein [Trebonia sp.]|nr:RodZ domain-containing protein [Trebonia sp.]